MKTLPDDILSRLEKYADLGHAKQNKAFLRQVAFTCSSPGTTTPHAAGRATQKSPLADALSMYRFANNEKISLADLRTSRARVVMDTVEAGSDILLIHDMSVLNYTKHSSKRDRRVIADNKGLGYEYVCCTAVDPRTSTTLGVIHDTVINNEGPDDLKGMDYDYEPLFADFSKKEKKRLYENHRHQMAVHINETSSLLSPWHVIDVADREFDDVFVIDRCQRNNRDFVIRSNANRTVQMPKYDWATKLAITPRRAGHPLKEGYIYVNFKQTVEHVPMQPYKKLWVNAHNRVVDKNGNTKRSVNLSIGSFTLCIYKDAKRNMKYFKTQRPVDINVVVIRELNPPPDCNPLCWILFTSLPIETYEQMTYVGEIYEMRWKIEDFFKLLKSGYRILDSRLNNADKIARYIIVLTLAAMTVLDLKRKVGLPSKGSMNDKDYRYIKTAMLEPDNFDIDLNLRLFAFIAKSGGWLGRRSDPIGPTILIRGMLHLLAVVDSIAKYGPMIEEALQNPHVLRRLLCV